MAYTPTLVSSSVALSAATLEGNLADFRTEITTISRTALSGTIATDKICTPRILNSTAEGYEARFESGFIISRKQPSSDLRAPAFDGVWSPPAGWTWYDPNDQRNVDPANRSLNGVVSVGNINNSGASFYVERDAYVIVSMNFSVGPMPVGPSISDPTTNNPSTLLLTVQHRDENGNVGFFGSLNINRRQPFVVLDSYLRNHTLRVGAAVNAGWHSWALLARDPTNLFAYSYIGALTTTVEGFYAE